MRAAILAGGKGTRIGGLFPELPKPMIPVCGKPLLQRQVEALADEGIRGITLILGYKADIIREFFEDGSRFGARISYIAEETPLGTGGALAMLPAEDTLIIYGDVFFEADMQRFIFFHNAKKAAVTLFAHPNSHPYDSDIVIADAGGRVTAMEPKNNPQRGELRNLVNAGLYIFSADTLGKLAAAAAGGKPGKRDLERDIIAEMIPGGGVYACRSTEYVKDMGTPERLREVETAVLSGMASAKKLKNKQKAVFIDRDGTINEQRGLISSPEQIALIPGAAGAIKRLNGSEYLAICITNQPVIARGMATEQQLDAIHARLDTLLGQEGAYLDDLYYCPHHPDKGYPGEVPGYKIECDCRKPKPGMIFEAAQRYNIDLSKSYMIGDATTDIAAGKAAGCRTIGVRTGRGLADGKCNEAGDYLCADIPEAAGLIIDTTAGTTV